MEPTYRELRNCLCATHSERVRFRQLIVNSVMATDIADKELNALRRQRWDKAFNASKDNKSPQGAGDENLVDATNRKATIVIEHLLQVRNES